MKIRTMTITNFRAIEGTIEFDNRSGVGLPLLIHGRNAVGKTTIFDCLTLLLFRVIDRKGKINQGFRLDSLINNDAQEMYISADLEGMFRLDPNLPPQKCVLRFTAQQHKTPKNAAAASVVRYRIFHIQDNKEEELTIPTVTNCSGSIIREPAVGFQRGNSYNHLLEMDYNAFRSSIFIAQDGFSRFFENQEARKSIITQLLNVDFAEEECTIADIARAKERVIRTKKAKIQELKIDDTFDSWNLALESVQASIQQCEQEQDEIQLEITQLSQDVGVHKKQIEEYEEHLTSLRTFARYARELDQIEEEVLGSAIQEKWNKHTYYPVEVRNAYWTWTEEYDHEPEEEVLLCYAFSAPEKSKLPEQMPGIEAEVEKVIHAKGLVQELEVSIQKEMQEIAGIRTKIEDLEAKEKTFFYDEHRAYLDAIGSLVGVEASWETHQQLHPALRNEVPQNKVQVHQSIVRDFENAVVEREDAVRRREALKELRAERADKEKLCAEKQKEVKQHNDSIRTLLDSLESPLHTSLSMETSIQQVLKKFKKDYSAKLMEREVYLLTGYDWNELCADILSKEEAEEIEEQRKSIAGRESLINKIWSDRIQGSIVKKEGSNRAVRLELGKHAHDRIVSTKKNLKVQIQEKESKIVALQEKQKTMLEETLFSQKNRLNSLRSLSGIPSRGDREIHEQTKQWFAELNEIQAECELYKQYRTYVGFGGHTQSFTSRALGLLTSDLVNTANRYLSRFVHGDFHLRPRQVEGVFIADVSIIDQNTCTEISYSDLSGGQRFLICLAFSLALSDQLSNGKNQFIHTLIIDEGFGSLDEENCQSVVDILKQYSQEYNKRIICIAHTEYLKSRLKNSVEIKKSNGQTDLLYSSID